MILTITTVDIKYGANEIVCKVFLSLVFLISLNASAKIIGNGNPITKDSRLRTIVFLNMAEKIGMLNNCLKYLNPAYGLPNIPFLRL